ncbi:MAG: hypothetical protein EDM82_07205 [Cyanobacteria bacterium CYA]|nr:MAG: hypothetical protein EDM82_07205 [Cyanobacteria bacterium CYA]
MLRPGILTNISRPTIAQQLAAVRDEVVQEFICFDATVIAADPARRIELRHDLLNNTAFQSADFHCDMHADGLDYMAFYSTCPGTAFVPPVPQQKYDFNRDGVINPADRSDLQAILRAGETQDMTGVRRP